MPATLDPTNTLLQTYQGIANTAGPYFNLASALQPGYGQLGLSNLQQQLFGYTTGQPGTIGYPATPAGGFVGDPNYGNYGGAPTVGPVQGGGTPTGIEPAAGSFNPFLSGGSTGAGVPGITPYSPDQGSLIGLGPDRTFNDPYAGVVGPAQAGPQYHPGVLGMNTTALGAYGPAVTQALLQSNPYLFDALNLQNNAAYNAATPTALQGQLNQNALGGGGSQFLDLLNQNAAQNSGVSPLLSLLNQSTAFGPEQGSNELLSQLNQNAGQSSSILSQLNQQAQEQLASNGQLSPQQQHDLSQLTGSLLAPGTQGPQSIVAQLFARDAATQQRMQAAQQFGQQVEAQNQAQNQFGLGVQGANQAQNQYGLNSYIAQGQYGLGVQGANQAALNAQNQYGIDIQNLNQNALNAQNQFGLNVQQGNIAQQGLAGSLAQSAANSSGILTNSGLQILGLGNLNANANPSQSIQDQSNLFNPFMEVGTGIANANYNAQQAQSIADDNNDAALWGSLINAGGSLLGGAIGSSDERIKKNIKTVGKSRSGIPIKTWVYKTDPKKKRYSGAMAQDVERFNPYAVHTDPMTGMKSVDYSQIDVQMEAA